MRATGPAALLKCGRATKSVLEVLCPSMEPRLSTRTGTFFWKGSLPLIDGSAIEVRVAEVEDDGRLLYYPVISNPLLTLWPTCVKHHSRARPMRSVPWSRG